MEDVPRGRSDFGTPAPDALTGLAKEMHEAFSPEGLLAKSPDFEYRAEQQRMAVEVGQALEKHGRSSSRPGRGWASPSPTCCPPS